MNYYEILGVGRNASAQEIKKAYRRLAKKWHPDLNRDNAEVAGQKMRELNIAYDTLSSEVSRFNYDKKLDAEFAKAFGAKKTAPKVSKSSSNKKVNVSGIHGGFESFFGFNPSTHEIVDEDKLSTFVGDSNFLKNKKKGTGARPAREFFHDIDFERFVGIKRQ